MHPSVSRLTHPVPNISIQRCQCGSHEPPAPLTRLRAVQLPESRANRIDPMVRHPAGRRVHRKAAETEDVFVEGVLETSVWVKEHALQLVIAAATIFVVIAVGLYYRSYRTTLTTRATEQLTQVRQTVQSGNTALAIRDLQSFLDRFGNTSSAREAHLMLAQAYLDNNDPQKAVDAIRDLARDPADPLGTSAAFLLGAAYENLNQPDAAESIYLRIANTARFDYQKVQALQDLARVRTERGNTAGAVEAYQRILSILPDNDPQRPTIEMRLAEARARSKPGS